MKLQLLLFALAMLILAADQLLRKDVVNWFKQRWYMLGLRRLAARLNAQMVAATAIVVIDRPGGFHFQFQFSLDPGAIAAGGREVETVALPGAQIGDVVAISPRYATSLVVGYARVSAAGVVTFALENNTAGALDEGNNIWDGMLIRGTTGPLR